MTTVNLTAASGSWTAPAGVTSVFVECYGGGGGSGGAVYRSGGAAGGNYANKTLAVTPGQSYSYAVGSGGTGGPTSSSAGSTGGNGGATWFLNASTVIATGGGGSTAATSSGVSSGGSPGSGSIGDVVRTGGSGGTTNTSGYGGGGGSAAGPNSNGNAGVGGALPSPGGASAGGMSGAGGAGGRYSATPFATDGFTYGGGAGGGYASTNLYAGKNGAAGVIVLTYTADTTAPTAPGQPALSNQTTSSVTLTWTASASSDTTGYEIYKDGTLYSTLGNVLTTNVTGLSAGTSYSFTIKAKDAAGNTSSPSTAATYVTSDVTAPTAPGQPTLSNQAQNSVTLTWTPATDTVGVTGYKVYKDGTLYATLGNVLTTNVTGLTPGTQYSFTVTALDAAANESSPSTARTYTPADTTSPSTPANLAVTGIADTTISLSWTASTDNVAVTGYEVRRNGTTSVGTPSGTTFTDTGLADGTSYSYQVRARDAAGNWSAYSSPSVSASTNDTTAPGVPSSLSITNRTATTMTITWTAPSDNTAVTGYRVRRNNGTPVTLTDTTFTDTGLTDNTQYTYDVAARDAAGNWSDYTSTVSEYTRDGTAPSAPAGLQASASNLTVSLSWTAPADNVGVTGYNVYRGVISLGTQAGTSFTEARPVGIYTYSVTALDEESNESNPSSITVTVYPVPNEPSIGHSPTAVKTGTSTPDTTIGERLFGNDPDTEPPNQDDQRGERMQD